MACGSYRAIILLDMTCEKLGTDRQKNKPSNYSSRINCWVYNWPWTPEQNKKLSKQLSGGVHQVHPAQPLTHNIAHLFGIVKGGNWPFLPCGTSHKSGAKSRAVYPLVLTLDSTATMGCRMAEAAAAKPRGVPPPQAVGGRSPAGTAPRLPLPPAGEGEREGEKGENPPTKCRHRATQRLTEANSGAEQRAATNATGSEATQPAATAAGLPVAGGRRARSPKGRGKGGTRQWTGWAKGTHAVGKGDRSPAREPADNQGRACGPRDKSERPRRATPAQVPERNAGGKAPRPGSGSGAMRRTGTAKRRPGPPGQHRRALLPKSSASAGCAVPKKAGFSPQAGTTSGVWAEPNGDGMPPNANGGVGQGPRPRRCKCGITMYPPRGLGPRGGMCQTERAHASGYQFVFCRAFKFRCHCIGRTSSQTERAHASGTIASEASALVWPPYT